MFGTLFYLACLIVGSHISNAKSDDSYAINAEANQNLLVLISDNDSHTIARDTKFEFSKVWQKLGPFQTGTREVEWGADPLEAYGGFRNLRYNESAVFRSSISPNGISGWKHFNAEELTSSGVSLKISYNEVDWQILRTTYGWAGLQFQAWVRGKFHVHPDSFSKDDDFVTAALYMNNTLEVWVDGIQYFGGDVYSYNRAPVILQLESGYHEVDIRAIHDIRMFGGDQPPSIEIQLGLVQSHSSLFVDTRNAIVPDLVGGRVSSRWISMPLRNDGQFWMEVSEIKLQDQIVLSKSHAIRIAPGQIRPVKFKLEQLYMINKVDVHISYREDGKEDLKISTAYLNLKDISKSTTIHKYTYLHPSGIASYSLIRPPSQNGQCQERDNLVLLALHGAGNDVDSSMVRESFDALPDLCAWLVIPQGVTTWSGDDWHTWGLADAEAAIQAIPTWIQDNDWKDQGVTLDEWVVVGHSNGGQGAWHTMAHRNEYIVAGAPISGYLSVPAYVPYVMWHESDPRAMNVVLAALTPERHELLVDNLVGVPILQAHGSEDDNVPVFHSRRMFQLLGEANTQKAELFSNYTELKGKPHWFEGIMTSGSLKDFLIAFLNEKRNSTKIPKDFEIVTGNPGVTGHRNGIKIEQLISPDKLGRIHVSMSQDRDCWSIQTSNVRRWRFGDRKHESHNIDALWLDGILVKFCQTCSYLKQALGWEITEDEKWKEEERNGRQLGPMKSILNTTSKFYISYPEGNDNTIPYSQLAIDVSRNLYQYFAADTELVVQKNFKQAFHGNTIFINELPIDLPLTFPISMDNEGNINLHLKHDSVRTYRYEPGLGAIFLVPLPDHTLGLVMLGVDEEGLRRVLRLLPLRTGVGQPDFVILGRKSAWKGLAGGYALGFFDHNWQITLSSYIF